MDEASGTISGTARERLVTWHDPRALANAALGMAGIDFLRALVAGDLPPPPIVALLGIRLVAVEPGLVTMALSPGEHLYNPIGSVHGGAIATLLDSVLGCAVHSMLPAGRGYTTLEIKVNYVRALSTATGEGTAIGRAVHVGRQTALAEATLTDPAGRLLATASTTCLVFDLPPQKGAVAASAPGS